MIPKHEKIMPQNLETINRSFAVQAPNFDSKSVNFTKKEYLDYTVTSASPSGTDIVLEVAAGTCACGRVFAHLVQTVVCLDATTPMLQVGKQGAQENHLDNMVFVLLICIWSCFAFSAGSRLSFWLLSVTITSAYRNIS